MSNLYLYNYNNYFNRIVKKESSLANYGTPIYTLKGTNFDMNDSVTSQHTINYANFDGDYVIITDNNDNITSRWFVMENKKQRGGQHTLYLRRDLIVDNYDKVINAPCLINRAMINDETNPLLFNPEGFSFNQIKQEEILLKDKTETPWYILYFNKNTPFTSGSFTLGDIEADYSISVDIDDNASPFKAGSYSFINNQKFGVNYGPVSQGGLPGIVKVQSFELPSRLTNEQMYAGSPNDFIWFNQDDTFVELTLFTAFNNTYNTLKGYVDLLATNTLITESRFNTLSSNTNLRVLATSGGVTKLYQVNVNITSFQRSAYATTGNIYDFMTNTINSTTLTHTGSWGNKAFPYSYTEYIVTISHSEINTSTTVNWTLDFANQVETTDAPYNVVAIPVNNFSSEDSGGQNLFNCKESANRMLVNSMIKSLATYLYDVQILPYFPLISLIDNEYGLYITNNVSLGSKGIEDPNGVYGKRIKGFNPNTFNSAMMIFVDTINFTFDISQTISIKNRDSSNSALNKKLSSELDLYRLVSPNYNGQFEFSVAKNNGVNFFNVDVTLRPYNPYIHVNPNFKNLYGIDFNDSRGLICQGDFSIPIITDRFIEYEYQNKNYLQTFNRQIEHLDFEYSKAQTEALFGATVGSIGAGLSGGLTGGKIGGSVGAITGATIGSLTSAIGGAVDYNILKQRQAENKDLMIDNFNYQLGNIKALPYSINKVTAYTFNNKIWPFVEVYSATQEEENIIINKIKWSSMTINAIGTMANYILTTKTYISGSLIRLEGLDCQMHEAQEIYDEIMKGVFI